MSLMRVFAMVNAEGKITIPVDIQRETGLKTGQLVEIRVVEAGQKKKRLVISARENAR